MRLNQLLDNFSALTAEEASALIALSQEYPYSQVLTTLTARATWDHQFAERQLILQQAALRSPDRSVLKKVITAPRKTPKAEAESTLTEVLPPASKEKGPTLSTSGDTDSRSGEQVRKELISDLHELSRLMKRFETQVERVDMLSHKAGTPAKVKGDKPVASVRVERPEVPTHTAPAQNEKKTGQKLKDSQKEEKEIARLPDEEIGKLKKEKKAKDKKGKKGGTVDPLLKEIKEKKKKINPTGKKRKAQRELIDRFIKDQPALTKPAFTTEPGIDLAEASTAFSDQIISETLVEILIKQGKREKAIEVLKKLIWKIPKKKATFAAQIEELKQS